MSEVTVAMEKVVKVFGGLLGALSGFLFGDLDGMLIALIALICLYFLKTVWVATLCYSLGLIYSGIIRIIQAFRRTSVVYIQ